MGLSALVNRADNRIGKPARIRRSARMIVLL
jgi:hypothetical protein